MNLEVTEKGSGIILKISGIVESDSAHRLEEELNKIIDNSTQHVVVDLQDTEFLGSAAICHLVVGGKRITEQARSFYISPNASIRKVLAMGGVDNLFPFVKTADKVVK